MFSKRKLFAVTLLLTACSTAYGEETLNLELLCEGEVIIDDPLHNLLRALNENQNFNDTFSQRFSIVDNNLGGNGPKLTVSDNLIYH